MSIDPSRVAAALRGLADAFEGVVTIERTTQSASAAPEAPTAAPAPRGRGRGVKQSADAVTAPAAPAAPVAAPVAEPDPFAVPVAVVAPTATIEEVRAALTDLKNATSQEIAVSVLKGAGGADNLAALSPASYGTVVLAAKAKQAEYAKPAPAAPVVEEDPFAVPAAAPVAAAKPLTIEDVKAAVLDATKRSGQDRAAKVVMDLGGKAQKPDGTGFGPSWTALPKEQYAAAIAGLKALPTTK